jgi:hypothetical protein
MNELVFKETDDLPEVNFDSTTGVLFISGRSFPENVTIFYNPVLEWVKKYCLSPAELTLFKIQIEYFNSASQKYLFEILRELNKIRNSGNKIQVEWLFPPEDEDLMVIGKEFEKYVGMEFLFVEI